MALVRKGNKLLRVKEFQVQRYLDLGYDEVAENGEIVRATVPNDVNVLKRAYIEHTARIAELEEAVANLEQKITELQTVPKTKSKSKTE